MIRLELSTLYDSEPEQLYQYLVYIYSKKNRLRPREKETLASILTFQKERCMKDEALIQAVA
jgi:hypothetical protein